MSVQRVVLWLIGATWLSGCHPRADVRADPLCGLPSTKWHIGRPEPVPSVVLAQVQQSRTGLLANVHIVDETASLKNMRTGPISASQLEAELSSISNLRPNAVLELISARDLSCDDILELGSQLDASFNCANNYCWVRRN